MDGNALRELRRSFGLTQAEVARAAGIHQPDLSNIERGRELRPRMLDAIRDAMYSLVPPSVVLDRHREELRRVLTSMGVKNPRTFGSVLHGTDRPGSDIDILAELPTGAGLLELAEITDAAHDVMRVPVDILPDDPRNQHALASARSEAVPL
ncbi:XRE family transcriptional regulator [Georgenia yuyongxinii]|uniref:XRE family transcriptional regulator n=1 Tax=Georgenia yuyongxinii TaxID=2589797 RepID=A0A5B8C8L8_9MICO|nr:XRE family transcriptional regulator [Georgenia yuyongxinii]QDC25725.1 XRE family transcriptional regulator [Georgenia yuyongxinii]